MKWYMWFVLMLFGCCWDFIFNELKILLIFTQMKTLVGSMWLFSSYFQLACKTFMEHGSGEYIFKISDQVAVCIQVACLDFYDPWNSNGLVVIWQCHKHIPSGSWFFTACIHMHHCAFVLVKVKTSRYYCNVCVQLRALCILTYETKVPNVKQSFFWKTAFVKTISFAIVSFMLSNAV